MSESQASTTIVPAAAEPTTKSLWTEYTHQDGRKYYYHTVTKQTVWQKPDELKTPKELALEACPWKEYSTPEGKKYYHNAKSSETVWTAPEEYKTLFDELAEETKAKEASTGSATSASTSAAAVSGVTATISTSAATTATASTATATLLATAVVTPAPVASITSLPIRPQTPSSSSTVSIPSPLRHQAIPLASHSNQHQHPAHPTRDLNGPSTFTPPQNPPFRQPSFPHQQGARPPRFQQSYVSPGPSYSPVGPPYIPSKPYNPSSPSYASKPSLAPNYVPVAPSYSPSDPAYSPPDPVPTPSSQSDTIRVGVREKKVNQDSEPSSKEAAEAFKRMLKETGVTSTWTWDQTMRAVISNPTYLVLNSASDRKATFQEYVDDRRIQERKEEKERQQKQRQDFLDLLKSSDKVTHASRYTTISRLFAEEPAFKAIEDDRARFSIFDSYVGELIRHEKEEARQKRKSGMAALLTLYQSMNEITFMTRWAQAQEMLQDNKEFKDSDLMRGLSKVDQLTVYEDHIKQLEKEHDQDRVRERVLRKRTERKRREAFKELLAELRTNGQLNAKSCWMQIHPLIKEDPRYTNMLGQPGSAPMDLFWDLVEDLDERLYQDRKIIQNLLSNMDYQVQPETTFDEFQGAVSKQDKAADISTEDLKLIFDQLLGKAIHYRKEETRRQEKQARRKAESFRSMLKNLNPAVTVDSTWEDVKTKAESSSEYAALETDEKRKEVFDRYIERLKGRVTKTHDSDDEDGSILEDDADLHGKKSGTSGASSTRGAPSNNSNHSKAHHSNSHNNSSHRSSHHNHSHHHSSNSNHHGSHGDSSRRSNANSRDIPMSTSNSSSSAASKRPHQIEKHSRNGARTGSGTEDESERHGRSSKKSKVDTEGTATIVEAEATKDVIMKSVNGEDDEGKESSSTK
ncbi:hypothetical protein BGX33_005305 [Mortierella sp. NVP41]|nr:hypothetical protein BGX33_005305 [Mortierella sp. NVP41]